MRELNFKVSNRNFTFTVCLDGGYLTVVTLTQSVSHSCQLASLPRNRRAGEQKSKSVYYSSTVCVVARNVMPTNYVIGSAHYVIGRYSLPIT